MSSWSKVNKELWLVLSLFVIAALLNFLMASHRMVLGFYILPTVFSAYLYGRRHATLTACASVILVGLLSYYNAVLFKQHAFTLGDEMWFDLAVWGGTLVVIAYLMGTLYERKEANLRELRDSYEGILLILQHLASNDKYSKNHPYRVSVCATRIAETLELDSSRIEDLRAAALLHDVERLGINRDLLYRAANLSQEEYEHMRHSGALAASGKSGGSLRRVIPIIFAHNELTKDSSPEAIAKTPLEASILRVADVYDSIATDRSAPMSPFEAIDQIAKRSGVDLDSRVVGALVKSMGTRAAVAQPAGH